MRCAERVRVTGVVIGAMVLALASSAPGAPKKAPPKPAAEGAAAGQAGQAGPADVNELKLRVTAMQALFELDLSAEQLRAVRASAEGAADPRHRDEAKTTEKLTAALRELHEALAKRDGARVDELQSKADDLEDEDDVDLDDAVHPTDAARARTAAVVAKLKASQIAAYLADHADEVADPAEQLMDALAEVRDPDADDADAEMQDSADDVGRLVAGLDGAKAKAVSDAALAWLKAGRALSAEDYAAKRAGLEESAKKIVGDVPPMVVLGHWVENEVAELLSNPQLPGAVDAMLAGAAAKK